MSKEVLVFSILCVHVCNVHMCKFVYMHVCTHACVCVCVCVVYVLCMCVCIVYVCVRVCMCE